MTATPLTDNLARGNHVVPTEFAQDLELERDNLQDQRDFAISEMERLKRERDEAIAARKASAADWLNQVEQANARVSRALRRARWVSFETPPDRAGVFILGNTSSGEVGQARWMPRKGEWKFPSAAMAFRADVWTSFPVPN